MIRLTTLTQHERWLNADLIISVESTPDTVVVLLDGHRFIVRETPQEIREAAVAYHAAILAGSWSAGSGTTAGGAAAGQAAMRAAEAASGTDGPAEPAEALASDEGAQP